MNFDEKIVYADIMGIDVNSFFGALIVTKHAQWAWKSSFNEMNHLKFVTGYTNQATFLRWPAWTPQTWNSVCLTTNNSVTNIYSNGQLVATVNKDLSGYDRKKNILLLATRRGTTTDQSDENQLTNSVFGSITDVNIWNKSLSQKEVKGWSSFKLDLPKYKLLDWFQAKLQLEGTQVEDHDLETIKKEAMHLASSFSIYTLKSEFSFQKGKYNCEGIGGSVSIPGDNVPLSTWNQSTLDPGNNHCHGRFYTGYSELYEEDDYVSLYSNISRSGIKWGKGTKSIYNIEFRCN